MKSITYNQNAFLLNLSANINPFNNTKGNSVTTHLIFFSFLKIVTLKNQQKSIDCFSSNDGFRFLNLKNRISNHILIRQKKPFVTSS